MFSYKSLISNKAEPTPNDSCLALRLAHEGTGVIKKIGESASCECKVGDKVTSIEGNYADYWLTSQANLVKMPTGLDPKYVLGGPVGCAIYSNDRFGIRLGDRVSVIGAGFMGIRCIQIARLKGASFILAQDPIDWRLAFVPSAGSVV